MRQMLQFGAIKPTGWIRHEIEKTLEGCIGHLDELVPDLIQGHKIYGRDRLHSKSKLVDLGRIEDEKPEVAAADDQFFWWNSETQSNWLDGFLRSAFLVEDSGHIKKAERYAEALLETQTEDGYIGIYSEELRFKCKGENGELWAQSTAFRALLAYYEVTGKEEILRAVQRAAECTMRGFPIGESDPFGVKNGFSGHGHGLTITDAFYRLYEHTCDKKYMEYATWLYENYSANTAAEEDLQLKNVLDADYFFKGHGVHTYEMIRALIIAADEKKEYEKALNLIFAKLSYYLTPSGAPIGDEWIFGRTADAANTGYEYCSLQELLDTYLFKMRISGELKWADKAEWLFYNASFGMRHPKDSSIMYLKTDNSYEICEKRQPGDVWNPRYKYSPTHQDVAVCCVPNSGRIMPYFVQNMLMLSEDEIKVALYGPMVFEGKIKGIGIRMEQDTTYPLEFKSRIKIKTEEPVSFTLTLRFPEWADKAVVNGIAYEKESAKTSELSIHNVWKEEQVEVFFETKINFKTDRRMHQYVCYGPLVFALPIESREEILKDLELKPFQEKGYLPVSRECENWSIKEESREKFQLIHEKEAENWKGIRIKGFFYDGKKERQKELIPMGGTILRKVTFPMNPKEA